MRPNYIPRETYQGDGATTEFTFDFKIVDKAHLLVILSNDLTGEIIWETRGTDTTYFTTQVNKDGSGKITLLTEPLVNQTLILLLADDQPKQLSKYSSDDRYTMKQIEGSLDALSGQVQRIRYLLDRSFKIPEQFVGTFTTELALLEPESVLVLERDDITGDWSVRSVPRSEFVGDKGDQGDAATVSVGTVTELTAGVTPTVSNSGDIHEAVLDFGLPGSPTIQVGDVTEIDPDDPDPMSVTNVGTPYAAIFDFVLRKGDRGEQGVSTVLFTVSDQPPDDGVGADGDVWLFLKNGDPDNGDFFQKVSGSYVLKGNIKGPAGGVNTFNTRTGNVVPVAGDYEADMITYDNLGSGLIAVDVQDAIDEAVSIHDADQILTEAAINDLQDQIDNLDPLPDQTGNAGKYLQTDGTDTSWEDVDALPSQAGHTGKFLQTNGTVASWVNVDPPGISVSNTQTLNNAATIVLLDVPMQRVKVKGSAAGNTVVLPNGTRDGQLVYVLGMDSSVPVIIANAGNMVSNGDRMFNAGDLFGYMWDAETSKWNELRGM